MFEVFSLAGLAMPGNRVYLVFWKNRAMM